MYATDEVIRGLSRATMTTPQHVSNYSMYPPFDSRSPSPLDIKQTTAEDTKENICLEDERLTSDIYTALQTIMMKGNSLHQNKESTQLYNLLMNEVVNCSITQRPIENPVLDPTSGRSYEKNAIERWIVDRSETSPLTRQRLTLFDLKQNLTLRDTIYRMQQVSVSLVRAISHLGDFVRNGESQHQITTTQNTEIKLQPTQTAGSEDIPSEAQITRSEIEAKVTHKPKLQTMLYGMSCSVLLRSDLVKNLQSGMDSCCSTPMHSMLTVIQRVFDTHIGATNAYKVIWTTNFYDDSKEGNGESCVRPTLKLRKRTLQDNEAFQNGRIVLYLMAECVRIDMTMDQFCRLCGLQFGHILGAVPGVNDYIRNPATASVDCSIQYAPSFTMDAAQSPPHHCMSTSESKREGYVPSSDRKGKSRRRDGLCGCVCSETTCSLHTEKHGYPGVSGCILTRYNSDIVLAPCLTARIIPVTQMATGLWFRNPKFERNSNTNSQDGGGTILKTLRHMLIEADSQPVIQPFNHSPGAETWHPV